MTTVGNIGPGLFILIVIWILALILFVVSVRLQSNFGWICLASATLFTLILTIIPTESNYKPTETYPEEKDYGQIYKYFLLVTLIVFSVLSVLVVFLSYCIESHRPKLQKSFRDVYF